MRKRDLRRVFEAAKFIAARRCDIFVEPYTCITEDDGKGPWNPCDPCLLAQAGTPVIADLALRVGNHDAHDALSRPFRPKDGDD